MTKLKPLFHWNESLKIIIPSPSSLNEIIHDNHCTLDILDVDNKLNEEELIVKKPFPKTLSFSIILIKQYALEAIYKNLDKCLSKGFVDEFSDWETFIRILSSEDLLHEPGQIKFLCNNIEIAYIFLRLKPWFRNLTFSAIGKSQKFFNKNGKPLNRGDLYYALLRGKKDNWRKMGQIDMAFNI